MFFRVVPVLALIAVLAVWLRAVPLLLPWGPKLQALPAVPMYRLELAGTRNPAAPALDRLGIGPDELLSVVLRPLGASVGPIEVRAYLGTAGETLRWPVVFERFSSGTFALRGPVRELPALHRGRFSLTFIIGRPWAIPAAPEEARARGPNDDWCMVRGEVEVVAQEGI